MCCRCSTTPLIPDVAIAILTTGQFVLSGDIWTRLIPEEATSVTARYEDDKLIININPTISLMEHHAGRRLAGAVMFEIAAKYAEKVNGTIVHLANVGDCATEKVDHTLARYPLEHLDWARVCLGFRSVWGA